MRLIIGKDVDDPVFENTELLARVGCGICELRGEPIHVQAVPEANEVVSDEQLVKRMAEWASEHAARHTEAEHQEHERARGS